MSRYRWRGNDVAAAPSPFMIGEMEVIVGEACFAMNVDAFLACFALEDGEAVAIDSPPALSAETAVVVIAPVPVRQLSPSEPECVQVRAKDLPVAVPPLRLAPGKGESKHYGGPWTCPDCSHEVAGGRKCGACGATHPKLLAARPSPRIHRAAVTHG